MSEKETRITAPGKNLFNFAEITENRELLYFFTWRDLKVKYKQTLLGILWVVLQPLMLMSIFYFIFSRTLNISVGMSYPVYVIAGLVLWGFFSSGITNSSESLLNNSQIIRKIYFPRILVPVSAMLTAFVDFMIGLLLLLILILIFRQSLHWTAILFFPIAWAFTFVASFGIGSLLAALNVKYRDFRYLLPFLMQLLFFSSQVVYSIHSLPNSIFKYLLYLNPLNGALELFYYPLHQSHFNMIGVIISAAVCFGFIIAGLTYFKKTEAYFADLI
jgi:lipopolysaccharide transport system permease protein